MLSHAGNVLWWALCIGCPVLKRFLGTDQPNFRVAPGCLCQKKLRGSAKFSHRIDYLTYSPVVLELAGSCSTSVMIFTVLISVSISLFCLFKLICPFKLHSGFFFIRLFSFIWFSRRLLSENPSGPG